MKNFIQKLYKVYHLLPTPQNWKFWILLSLIIKSVFFYFFLFVQKGALNLKYNAISRITGDSVSYIDPFENLFEQGSYSPDFRMPGYGWLYYLLRFLFSRDTALNIIPYIQLLVAAISVYVLATLAFKLFKRKLLFYIVFAVYVILYNTSFYDDYILTESFTLSTLIFSVYFLFRGTEEKKYFFASGLFLTWAIFMKPVLLPLLFIYILFVLFRKNNTLSLKHFNKKGLLIFMIPFLLIEGSWVTRNYLHHHEFFVLTKTMYVPSINNTYYKSIFEFSKAIGISQNGWEPESEFNFFLPEKKFINQPEIKFSEEIFTSKFNMDSLKVVRSLIEQIQDTTISPLQKQKLDSLISFKLNLYTASIKQEKPMLYHIKSRINVMKLFFGHTGVYNLFNRTTSELSRMELLVKAFYSILYLFVVFVGIMGLLLLFLRNFKKGNFLFFLSLTGLYLVFIHPLVLKMDEYRYIISSFPFLVFSAAIVIFSIIDKIIKPILLKNE